MINSLFNKPCYLCGIRSANTKDHLFPEGLFPRPIPSNLPPRLPACRQCNEGLSKDEELFRVFIASGMAYEKAAGFRVWTERIRPDLQGKRPGLKPLLQSKAKIAPVISTTRGLLGLGGILEVEREPVHRVLNKIAKGLYFLDTGHALPNEVQVLTGYFEEPKQLVSPPLDDAIRGAIRVDLGDGVVTYWRNIMKDDPAVSITWLLFYQDKAFMICTFREST
jgi:hypothetical protein